jgi:hypothetical protein
VSAELVQLLQTCVVLKLGRGDIATLEAAIDVLESEPILCDAHHLGECAGPVYARTCADCGHTLARCDAHGGRKAVARRMWLHREQHRRTT